MISAPVFVAKTPEIFLELLQTVATKDKDKIGAFFKAHPESTQQGAWLKARPVPASYASVSYYGVHAFTLKNGAGESKVVKWKLVPKGGEVGLTDEEVKVKAADFYGPELKERLAKGPAEFDLTAIIGEASDPTNDPTALWPEENRKSVKMGTLTIAAIEDNATCDAGIFDPTNVTPASRGRRTTASIRSAHRPTACRSRDARSRCGRSKARFAAEQAVQIRTGRFSGRLLDRGHAIRRHLRAQLSCAGCRRFAGVATVARAQEEI